jgi:hypothetical protein
VRQIFTEQHVKSKVRTYSSLKYYHLIADKHVIMRCDDKKSVKKHDVKK